MVREHYVAALFWQIIFAVIFGRNAGGLSDLVYDYERKRISVLLRVFFGVSCVVCHFRNEMHYRKNTHDYNVIKTDLHSDFLYIKIRLSSQVYRTLYH